MSEKACNRKRKAKYYCARAAKSSRREEYAIRPGLKGFLCTCNYKEKLCLREAYSVLNEHADKLYGPERKEEEGSKHSERDILDDLDAEVAALQAESEKKPTQRRFQALNDGVKNCIFISTTLENPVELVDDICETLEKTQVPRGTSLLRMIPVEVTCKANYEAIEKAAKPLFDKHFKEPKTFEILYKARHNSSMDRYILVPSLAQLISDKHPLNKTDFKNPDVHILVEIVQTFCCLSVVHNFKRFAKYNLIEVATKKSKENEKVQQGDDDTPEDLGEKCEESQGNGTGKDEKEVESNSACKEESDEKSAETAL